MDREEEKKFTADLDGLSNNEINARLFTWRQPWRLAKAPASKAEAAYTKQQDTLHQGEHQGDDGNRYRSRDIAAHKKKRSSPAK